MEKTIASSANIAGNTGYLHARLKHDPCLSSCTSINSKWIKNINIRSETSKLVQKRAGNSLELIGKGNDFLNRNQMAQQLREMINKWDYMKLKTSTQQRNGQQIEEAIRRMGENI
jgi:hypothetical protein